MNQKITDAELYIRHKGEKIMIKSTEVILLSADINYTTFHLKDGRKYTSAQTIMKYDSYLHSHNFLRVNRNQIININEVKEITKAKRICTIQLHNGMNIQASRRKQKDVFTTIRMAIQQK